MVPSVSVTLLADRPTRSVAASPGARSGRTKGEGATARRAALIEAALDLFAARPYEDVSVDEICARAGVAHGLLSYHFGSKRRLFAAAVAAAWDELIASDTPAPDEVTVVDRFRGYLRRHFAYFRKHPDRFRLMTRSGHADGEIADILRASRAAAMTEIEASLGCPEGAPPRLRIALSGWGGFVDTVTLEYIEEPTVSAEQIADMCAQVLVASVRSANDIQIDAAVELETVSQVASIPD